MMEVAQIKKQLTDKIDSFIFDEISSRFGSRCWLEVVDENRKYVSIYVRIGARYVDGDYLKCFTIATIDIDPDYQQFGIFTHTLKHCIEMTRMLHIVLVIESVLSNHVERVALAHGFRKIGENYYLFPNQDSEWGSAP